MPNGGLRHSETDRPRCLDLRGTCRGTLLLDITELAFDEVGAATVVSIECRRPTTVLTLLGVEPAETRAGHPAGAPSGAETKARRRLFRAQPARPWGRSCPSPGDFTRAALESDRFEWSKFEATARLQKPDLTTNSAAIAQHLIIHPGSAD
jgi:hypothetical protein